MSFLRAYCGPFSLSMMVVAGCSSTPTITPPAMPAAIQAPADQTVFLEALATGVQIYECLPKANQPSTFEWTFRAPQASLVDRSGRSLGRHFAGPTWEAPDGSSVVGDMKARDPGPTPTAIPWLLLNAKSTAGTGVFNQTRSVQRVQTVGGVAPSEPCSSANANQIDRIPYTATYYFYRAAS